MGIGLTQIKHVKLPVADVRRSAAWYRTLLDLELTAEYVEQGEVRGVTLLDREAGFEISLRAREFCVGQPQLAGFDVFALRCPSRELLATVATRCDQLGIRRTELWDFPGLAAGFDVPDPDGIPVRIVWHDPHGRYASGFLGVESDTEGQPRTYDEPRLDLGGRPT